MIHLDFDESRFTAIVKQAVTEAMAEMPATNQFPNPERRTIHSIKGLAEYLDCSTVTAQTIKNSGRIPYMQVGRKVMFDTFEISKALEHQKRKGGAK